MESTADYNSNLVTAGFDSAVEPAVSVLEGGRLIPLTQGKFAMVDAADHEWLNQWKWSFDGSYAVRWIGGRSNATKIYMHRLVNQTPTGFDTDHQDRNKLNNQRYNLKSKTHAQNIFNRNTQSNNTSGYKGVSWDKGSSRWHAYIGSKATRIHLGYFKNIGDAVAARRDAEAKICA